MTDDQKTRLMGVVFGFSALAALASFVPFLLVADNASQAIVYSAFTFIAVFAAIRWYYLRKARRLTEVM